MTNSKPVPGSVKSRFKLEPPPATNGNGHHKAMPQAFESERGVLGCILLDPNASMPVCKQRIKDPEAFYDIRNQTLYQLLEEMYDNSEPIEFLAVHQRLQDKGVLEQIGGIYFLNDCQDSVPSAVNLEYYLTDVCDKHSLRKLVGWCSDMLARAMSGKDKATELLDAAERGVMAIRITPATRRTSRQVMADSMARIEAKIAAKGAVSGLTTGFPDLDHAIDGLNPTELIVPAAYTSMGKTALCMNIVDHVTVTLNQPVAVFSLEMSDVQLGVRMLCSRGRFNLRGVRTGNYTDADFKRLVAAASNLSASNLHIIEGIDTLPGLAAEARRLKQQFGIKLVVADYLQLLDGGRESSREQEVAGVAAGLKRMARELGIPVLSPSQLNDDGKLRESRAIGQHADGVWVLTPDEDVPEDADRIVMNLHIQKNRNGPRGINVKLNFLPAYTRFESASKTEAESKQNKGKNK